MHLSKEVFVIHITYLKTKKSIYLAKKAKIALLLVKKVIVLKEYSDFADIFLRKWAAELIKDFNINKHIIDLELGD